MSYEKQNFTDGQTLTAAHLNHNEEGIAAAESASGGASAALTETEKALLLALFGDTTFKSGVGAAKLAELTALWNVTQTKTLRTLAEGSGTGWNTITPKGKLYLLPLHGEAAFNPEGLEVLPKHR